MADTTGTSLSIDTGGSMLLWFSNVRVGSIFSVDTGGSMLLWDSDIRVGSVTCVDSIDQSCSVWSSGTRYGIVTTVDNPDQFNSNGIEISETTSFDQGLSFVQGSYIGPSDDLSLTFWDSTYVGGTLSDGTYSGGEYVTRSYNPTWLNYSIWNLTPPSGCQDSQWETQGCPVRTAMNPFVGHYSAFLVAPTVPGYYEIRWRYQKDQSSHAVEVDVPFTVTTWGISPFVLFNFPDSFGFGGFGEGGFGGSTLDSYGEGGFGCGGFGL